MTVVLSNGHLLSHHILSLLPCETAQALASCSKGLRELILSAFHYVPPLRCQLLINSVLLNSISTGSHGQTKAFARAHFHPKPLQLAPRSELFIEMGLSQKSTQALQATHKEPIEKALPSIAETGDLDLLEGALIALKQKPISQSTVNLLFSACAKAIQKNRIKVAQRLLTAIADKNTPPAIKIEWGDLLVEASKMGNAVLVQDILEKTTICGTLTSFKEACCRASLHNHAHILRILWYSSVVAEDAEAIEARGARFIDMALALDVAGTRWNFHILSSLLITLGPTLTGLQRWDSLIHVFTTLGFSDIVDLILQIGVVTRIGLLEALNEAAQKGDLRIIKRLLRTKRLVQQDLDNALELAVQNKQSKVIEFLRQTPITGEMTQADRDCQALDEAICKGQLPDVKKLLQKGNFVQQNLDNALAEAVLDNQPNIVNFLLQTSIAGGITQTGLDNAAQFASRYGLAENLQILLKTKTAGGISAQNLTEVLRLAAKNDQIQGSKACLKCIKACLESKKITQPMWDDLLRFCTTNCLSNNETCYADTVKFLLQKKLVSQSGVDEAFKNIPKPNREPFVSRSLAARVAYSITLDLLQTLSGGGLSQAALDHVHSNPGTKHISILAKKIIRKKHITRFKNPQPG